jgi:hypothetical protein
VLNLSRGLQASSKRSIELDVDGTMLLQRELRRTSAHAQDTEPNHFTVKLAQRVDNSLKEFIWRHFWDQLLFHLWAQLQLERPSRDDENSAETAAANGFGQKGLATGA